MTDDDAPAPAGEWLEVLDADGRPTGVHKRRDDVHRDGDWHLALHVWLARPDGTVLVQRRAPGKDLAPGKVDVSVGGHVRAGELPFDAVREVEEELGLHAEFGELIPLGRFRSERHYADAVDREVQEAYLLLTERPLQEFGLDAREVDVLYEVPLESAIALWRDGSYVPAPGWDAQRRVNNALLIEDDLIEPARAVMVAELEAVRDALASQAPASAETE